MVEQDIINNIGEEVQEVVESFVVTKETMLTNLVGGLAAAMACAFFTECINWYVIYRHDEYKKLTEDILDAQDKIGKLKDKMLFSAGTLSDAQRKAQNRKVMAAEQGLRSQHNSLMQSKSKGMMVVAVFMIAFMSMINSHFSGKVIAKLPFTPFSLMQNMTHYGLAGEDYTDASMTIIFVLCNLSIGTYVKKVLALEGPRIAFPQQQTPWG